MPSSTSGKQARGATFRPGALRADFLLRPDVVFLNHGSFGACPRPVFETYQAWQRELEAQPVEFLGRRAKSLVRDARESLAEYVGAGRDDLVFATNTTVGVNTVARALPLEPGDEVLATNHEYGACQRAWSFVCERRSARFVQQDFPLPATSAEAIVEALWAAVTPRTRVLFVSHITSPTAITLPVERIVARAREAGILTLVDGAHAPGQVPLDLRALDADFYVGNCHKWLCAPKGSAFLYARPEVQHLLTPLVVSWGYRGEWPEPNPFVDELGWLGTQDVSAYLSVPAAIEYQREHDWTSVQRACRELVREARQRIADLTGLEPLTADSSEWYSQMCALPLPPCDAELLKRRLYDEYRVEVPITVWRDHPVLRVSIQAYNTPEDVDALIDALRVLLPELRR